ncbi:MAG: Dyp-type peroxidase [Acidobacteriota bacterium]|nr:Dyp-type peroxidase [Acidobacteriota bacterium]
MAKPFIPIPILDGPFQPGITDPQWPVQPPDAILKDEVARERYELERAGRIDPQNFLTVVTADVNVRTRVELSDVLKSLSSFAKVQMSRKPDDNHIPILREIPSSWRVTVTIGLGGSIFFSAQGDDRFGLRHHKPKWLRTMPKVTGDEYDPGDVAADLIFLIASDHPYVNVSIARALSQGNWGVAGTKETRIFVRTINQGFSRPDRREFLRFDDGIDNLSNARDRELDKFVYVSPEKGEPEWCINGTYLVWRKIRENLPFWEAIAQHEQEKMIGRKKDSGKPLARQVTGPSGMTPVFPDPKDAADGPLTAHIRKVQPRRSGNDLFGIADLERRFLRRGYPYFEGLDEAGKISCGLLFLAFMSDLHKQFEWPVQNWQTNPDFPSPGTGIDVMYGSGVLSNVTGGYYFCPPAPAAGSDEFLASAIFR